MIQVELRLVLLKVNSSGNLFQVVNTKEEIFALMKKGEESRHTGKTKMNERSSRSHTIFRFHNSSLL